MHDLFENEPGPSPYQRAMRKVAELKTEIQQLEFLVKEERATIDELAKLCLRAADALDCHNLDHLQDDLIDELRKAAE